VPDKVDAATTERPEGMNGVEVAVAAGKPYDRYTTLYDSHLH
jgi:hypothetical protein